MIASTPNSWNLVSPAGVKTRLLLDLVSFLLPPSPHSPFYTSDSLHSPPLRQQHAMDHLIARPLHFTLSVLKLACTFHLVATNLVQCSPASGPSMVPTFTVDGEWLLSDMTCRRGRRIAVGDLVLYRIPIFADQSGVKRVIGMPGDYVSLGTPSEGGGHGSPSQMIQVSFSSTAVPTGCERDRDREWSLADLLRSQGARGPLLGHWR